jgi:hypothetical protein
MFLYLVTENSTHNIWRAQILMKWLTLISEFNFIQKNCLFSSKDVFKTVN